MKNKYRWYPHKLIGSLAILAVCTLILVGAALATNDPIIFNDVQRQTKEFLQYEESIILTPEQEKVKYQALSNIPAPCCSNFSIETCCCPCNMARAVWGLSKFLITKHGYNAAQVHLAVVRWFDTINPDGFSGKACYIRGSTPGCEKSFRNDGCGGMNKLKF